MNTQSVSREELNALIDPLTVVNNGFELLRHRFEKTMDTYALQEFERIERALIKLTEEIANLRDKNKLE